MKGVVDEEVPLGALAAKTLISAVFDETVLEKTRISSIVATWALNNWTPLAERGPIQVGLAHSDYSDAEVEEWIENAGSWNRGDKVSQEIARRLVRSVGIFDAASLAAGDAVLNDGRPIKTKLNWTLITGQTLRLWAYNLGVVAVGTTDPNVLLSGHANLWGQ